MKKQFWPKAEKEESRNTETETYFGRKRTETVSVCPLHLVTSGHKQSLNWSHSAEAAHGAAEARRRDGQPGPPRRHGRYGQRRGRRRVRRPGRIHALLLRWVSLMESDSLMINSLIDTFIK